MGWRFWRQAAQESIERERAALQRLTESLEERAKKIDARAGEVASREGQLEGGAQRCEVKERELAEREQRVRDLEQRAAQFEQLVRAVSRRMCPADAKSSCPSRGQVDGGGKREGLRPSLKGEGGSVAVLVLRAAKGFLRIVRLNRV